LESILVKSLWNSFPFFWTKHWVEASQKFAFLNDLINYFRGPFKFFFGSFHL
jgi:hypothetical protein